LQYEQPQKTKLTVRSDFATGEASSHYGANLDAIAFNVSFIARRRPRLAVELLNLWREATTVKASDPSAAPEDFAVAEAELTGAFGRRT
jgi:hypothetical protein